MKHEFKDLSGPLEESVVDMINRYERLAEAARRFESQRGTLGTRASKELEGRSLPATMSPLDIDVELEELLE